MAVVIKGEYNKYVFEPRIKKNFLGEGGMSRVYTGEVSHSGEKVAIKVLKKELSDDPSIIKRAKKEGVVKLNHENILRIIEFIKQDGKYHLVTEYLEGVNLQDYIKQQSSISFESILEIVKKVLKGLRALHALNPQVIHRDIKPSNIMICNNGDVKIMDFGVSRIRTSKTDVSDHTKIGVQIGTVKYAAPEQFSGRNDLISTACDTYAVGMIFKELIRNSNDNKIKQLPNLKRILEKSTQQMIQDRYQTPGEFLKELEKLEGSKKRNKINVNYKLISILVTSLIIIGFLIYILKQN